MKPLLKNNLVDQEKTIIPLASQHVAILLTMGLGIIVYFSSLGQTLLWDEDEGFYASTAAEMFTRGDWIVPYFNGQLFAHKPPWMFWMMMVGYSMFGVNEYGARVFSAVFALATVFLVFRFSQKLFNTNVAIWSAIIFSTSIMFTVVGRTATPDSFLVFFSTLSLYIFAEQGFLTNRRAKWDSAPDQKWFPKSCWAVAGIYGCMGLATLTKGPIGFVLPMSVIGLFLMLVPPRSDKPTTMRSGMVLQIRGWLHRFTPVRFFQTLWSMRPLTGVVILTAVAGPWFLAVGLMTDWEFHRQFFGVHHFHRFSSSMDGHSGNLLYYPITIMIGMFPWTVLTVPAIIIWWSQFREKSRAEDHASWLFVVAWIGIYLLIFSIAATKLPNYILPAYPALAIFFAVTIDRWLQNPFRFFWHRASLWTLIGVGLAMLIGFPSLCLIQFGSETILDRIGAASHVQRQLAWLGLLGLPALIGGGLALYFAEVQKKLAAAVCLAAVAYLTVFGLWNFAAPWANQFQVAQRLAMSYRVLSGDQPSQLASHDFFRPTMVFYYRDPIVRLSQPQDVLDFWEKNRSGRVIINGNHYTQLLADLKTDVAIDLRISRFPEKGEIIVLRLKD